MKIEVGKLYKTCSGMKVRIVYKREEKYSYPFIGIRDGFIEAWVYNEEGGHNDNYSQNIFTEIYPWEDFKIDEPVMVADHQNGHWHKRHFAGTKDKQPCAWENGTTSWSIEHQSLSKTVWNYCRRPTEEELKA